jgi:hypothetical protein
VSKAKAYPSFDFFTADWLAGAHRYELTREQQAVMLDLAARASSNGGRLPADPAKLVLMLGMDRATWVAVGAPVVAYCCPEPPEDGELLFVRPFDLARQYADAVERSNAPAARGRRSAEVRQGRFGTAQPSRTDVRENAKHRSGDDRAPVRDASNHPPRPCHCPRSCSVPCATGGGERTSWRWHATAALRVGCAARAEVELVTAAVAARR